MTNDTLTFDVVLAGEVKFAARRAGATEADFKTLAGGDMFAQILPILRGYGRVVVDILAPVGEAAFPGATNFVASEVFTEDKFYLGDNFKTWFLGKVEANVASSVLNYGQLTGQHFDTPIIASRGGEEKAETSLAEVFHLTTLQPNGEEGALLTNGYANIFYVRDNAGVLRAVVVYWYGDRWLVSALAISRPYPWNAGRQVFSRKVV